MIKHKHRRKRRGKLPIDTRDIQSEFFFCIFWQHVVHAVRGDPCNCVVALAICDPRNPKPWNDFVFDHIEVWRNIVYLFNKDESICLRGKASSSLRTAVAHFDEKDYWQQVPADGLRQAIHPICGVRSLRYLRSPEAKAMRTRSRNKNKNKTDRRVYRRPDALTLSGVRHG